MWENKLRQGQNVWERPWGGGEGVYSCPQLGALGKEQPWVWSEGGNGTESRKEELSLQSGEPPEEAPLSLSTQCGLLRISVKHPQTPGQLRTDHQTQDS